jgi:hypothetical protein
VKIASTENARMNSVGFLIQTSIAALSIRKTMAVLVLKSIDTTFARQLPSQFQVLTNLTHLSGVLFLLRSVVAHLRFRISGTSELSASMRMEENTKMIPMRHLAANGNPSVVMTPRYRHEARVIFL